MNNAFVLTNGLLQTSDAKTAHGLIRGTERFTITAIIDDITTAGKDAGTLLDGHHRNIPIYESFERALSALNKPNYLIIGIATVGGILPNEMRTTIEKAIQLGIHIVNGLHEYLSDTPHWVELALKNNVTLTDIRKPKKREDLHFWSGEIFNVPIPIVAVIGMDCAMGKRTTARMLKQACQQQNIKAEMIYTGQTGWLQGGQYGFVFDSTLNDFVSGELEHAIVTCWNETQPDIIFLEGQSALRNPSGPCGMELLISGNAKYVVLMVAPKRTYYENEPHWGKIPTAASEIALIETIGSKVIAVAINTENCSNVEALELQRTYQEKLKIPVLLPIEEGVETAIPILKKIMSP